MVVAERVFLVLGGFFDFGFDFWAAKKQTVSLIDKLPSLYALSRRSGKGVLQKPTATASVGPVFGMGKGAFPSNGSAKIITLFISLPCYRTVASSSLRINAQDLRRTGDIGSSVLLGGKKKCKWFSQYLACLIRHYYYIW